MTQKMPHELLFGTAGTPGGSLKGTSVSGIERIRELGLGCMELEFVRGVKMGEKGARSVFGRANELEVVLSAHAPYYINLNSAESEKIDASIGRIYAASRTGSLCGARNIVFHPAYYHEDTTEKVHERVSTLLKTLTARLEDDSIHVILRPETTGKPSQFGSLNETLRLSSEIEGVLPCIDFAHLHARSNGAENSEEEFCRVLAMIEETLGKEALCDMHMHVSGIEYGEKGEKNHLNLEDSDLQYAELMKALKDFRVKGLLICESPDNEGDALLLKRTYEGI
ncbi:MAG: TIM barrel protein [Methanolobus sp.]|uniref:TIM barrel protein n=1 Tax=Methanolobus sp. TaxID=1874737 RepID=UPI002731EABF|nr:TIM barrel protein [Methanolobus sp.]MDP2216628.1 TIM barrel protein [Methanolobus sp.]